MDDQFSTSVEFGLKLSKRIYYGKERTMSAPKTEDMEKSESFLPTAPMVYAVVSEPAIVDNPDVPSYQPYVHGRCEPPAMIPLHMHAIAAEVDCYLDTAFVTVSGAWRVHCIMAGQSCDCRIAVPMGEQVATCSSSNELKLFKALLLKLINSIEELIEMGNIRQ